MNNQEMQTTIPCWRTKKDKCLFLGLNTGMEPEPIILFLKAENEADVVVHILREYPTRSLKDITINYICLEEKIKTIH